MEHELKFIASLTSLIGLECWGVTGGEGTGSVITLDIGDKILRNKPSENPHLSKLVAKYNPSHGFMLHSPWRIESNTKIISASYMPNDNNGVMIKGLNNILGVTINNIICEKPAFDLRIEFSNDINLLVFCSNIGFDYKECYTFQSLNEYFTVNYGGEIVYEKNT